MYNTNLISSLQAQRANFVEQIKLIDAMLRLNGVEVSTDELSEENNIAHNPGQPCPYKKGATSQEKLVAILKNTNRFLTINEMAGMVHEYEPKIKLEDIKSGLQSAKNLLLKSGSIVKHQVGTNNSNSFYGSPAWLGEDNKPLLAHMYNEEMVQTKNVITI